MPYESGGRADKNGNRFETNWVIYQMLEILDEKISYVILEALGDDEKGVDLWVGNNDGTREGQQCKGRNASKEYWDFGTANSKGIFINWKRQLELDMDNSVALVSPLAFSMLEDLISRAKNANENPVTFYKDQILNASREFISFFNNFCRVMDVNLENSHDLSRGIDYLTRINYRQYPDTELKNIVLYKIKCMFIGDEKKIYAHMIEFVLGENILGKRIDLLLLVDYLNKQEIFSKKLVGDIRILPKIESLNAEYKKVFRPLHQGMIMREEYKVCRQALKQGESLIIHGKAGRGKSGCAQDVIEFCEKNKVPYIAIKLDKKTPSRTSDKWGNDLGFPSSIPHCIHSISKNGSAVIILDQLDALRWTQAHSGEALSICAQIINEVKLLNMERPRKISIIMVCRTYDLENDPNIRNLFVDNERNKNHIKWKKVLIGDLSEDTVKNILGSQYGKLTVKLKEILRIPSNLYIWQKLDPNKLYSECSTASHLVAEWWKQLEMKAYDIGISEKDINETKRSLVQFCEKNGRIYIPIKVCSANATCLEFLSSNGFLIVQDGKISFAHQSLLDCFLVDFMLKRYYDGDSIISIIGDRNKQTPGRRYQVQMLLQELAEIDTADFICVGNEILESMQVRYYVKYVFFEVLNQIDKLDGNISDFILGICEDPKWGNHIVNNVIISKVDYVRALRKEGILDKWMLNPLKKDVAIRLIISISPYYTKDDVEFISKYLFKTTEDDNKFFRCFPSYINNDTDDIFELRMKYYEKYPQISGQYLNLKSLFHDCEIRTIRILAFMLEYKIKNHGESIYKFEEELLDEESEFLITKYYEVIDILLPFIPGKDEEVTFSDWNGKYLYKNGLERACVQILKKANAVLVTNNPDFFWIKYKKYFGTGNEIHNEIILDALAYLPKKYSDRVINYLCKNFENNIFEETSGNGDKLGLAKKVLNTHLLQCSDKSFMEFESAIIHYIPRNSKDLYLRRIEFNRADNGYAVYWSYWGDFQNDILGVLPNERLSKEAKELKKVLKRRFRGVESIYKYSSGHSGSVNSPISGKFLSDRAWLDILTNKEIIGRGKACWKETEGGFIESSLEAFSRSFNNAVSEEPIRMINLFLGCKEEIADIHLDSLFGGIAYSEYLEEIPVILIEEIISKYLCDYESHRALSICNIVEKRKSTKWSENILNIVKDIAINHNDPQLYIPNVTNIEDKEIHSLDMLERNAINCVRGKAAEAIGSLIWEDAAHYIRYKETIDKMTKDVNPVIKFASLFALWPIYNIDREWASERILKLFENDIRLAGFQDSKRMFFLLYPNFKTRILEIIKKCYKSEDNKLLKIGSYAIAEMFITKNEFSNIFEKIDEMNQDQAEAILHMVIIYFDKEEYNNLSKEIILMFKNSSLDLELPLVRLFYDDMIDLDRDKKFLIEIMSSDISNRIIHAFVRSLEEGTASIIDYKDIILSMSHNLILTDEKEHKNTWDFGDELSKLIISLYDETCNSDNALIRKTSDECLNIWDLMFERQIGSIRELSQKMMER